MKRKTHGFTLVELIIVIAVIGVLAAILIPVFSNVIKKANAKSALSDARNAISAYAAEVLDRQIMGDTTYPELITIIVQKGGRYYLFGYDTRHGSSLLVSNANEEGIEASNFNDLVTRYSWNGLDGSAYDPFDGNAYPSGDHGYFYLAPADQSNTNMRGIPGTRDASAYRRLDNDDALGIKVGRDAEIYQGTLVAGTFEGVMFDGENPVESTVKYQVVYHAGDNAPASLTLPEAVQYEDGTASIPVAGTPDYTSDVVQFAGWYIDNAGDNMLGGMVSVNGADVHLYAKWNPIVYYTITVNLDGGTLATPSGYETTAEGFTKTVRQDDGLTVADVIGAFGTPTKSGKIHKGWKYNMGSESNVPYSTQTSALTDNIYITAFYNDTFALVWDVNGGSMSGDFTAEGSYEIPKAVTFVNATKSGYVFKGWKIDGSDSEVRYWAGSSYTMSGAVTFKATWGQPSVKFVDNQSGDVVGPNDLAVDAEITLPTDWPQTHTGYTFDHYEKKVGDAEAETVAALGTMGTEDVVITLYYSHDQFPVTYTSNGVQIGATQNIYYGEDATPPTEADVRAVSGAVPTPESDYRWGGWSEVSTNITASKTITAVWEPKDHFYIHFVAGDNAEAGFTVPDDVTKNDDETFAVPSTSYEGDNYYFAGWFEGDNNMSGETIDFSDGGAITHTLTGHWEAIAKYTITVNLDGGTLATPAGYTATSTGFTKQVKQSADTTVSGIITEFGGYPTKTGFEATGWKYNMGSGDVTYSGLATALTADITITATYNQKYTLTWTNNGGTPSGGTAAGDYTVPKTITFPNMTKAGYVFKGWQKDGAGLEYAGGTTYDWTAADGDITFAAAFERPTITFIDDYNGQTISSQEYDVGTQVNAPSAPNHSADHRTFSGWTEGGVAFNAFPITVGNSSRTFRAEYGYTQYTITYAAGAHSAGGSTASQTFTYQDSSVTIRANGFTAASGYEFDGWKNESNNSTYTAGQSCTPAQIGGSVTLTAQWKNAGLTITFTDGASGVYNVTNNNDNALNGTIYFVGGDGEEFILPSIAECSFTAPAGKTFDTWLRISGDADPGPGDNCNPGESGIVNDESSVYEAQWVDAPSTKTVTLTLNDTAWNGDSATATFEIANSATSTTWGAIKSQTEIANLINTEYWYITDGTSITISDTTASVNGQRIAQTSGDQKTSLNPTYTVWDGSSANKYQCLTTETGLKKINTSCSTYCAQNYLLLKNVNVTGNLNNGIDDNNTTWKAIGDGDSYVAFSGCFDGNGKTVSGIIADWENDHVGFFANVSGVVKRLNVTASGIIQGTTIIGGIVGEVKKDGIIDTCTVQAQEICAYQNNQNNGCSGGIAGLNKGTIRNCTADADVTGFWYIGGIAGKNTAWDGSAKSWIGGIQNCTYTGSVNKTYQNKMLNKQMVSNYAGGIAGQHVDGYIRNCTVDIATGDKIIATYRSGGCVGAADGEVSNCIVKGSGGYVACYEVAGGFCGDLVQESDNTITNCHVTNTVMQIESVSSGADTSRVSTVGSKTGGFIGQCAGVVTSCSTRADAVFGYFGTGGFVGRLTTGGACKACCTTTRVNGSGVTGTANCQQVGGFFGRLDASCTIQDCFVNHGSAINGYNIVGAFGGFMSNGTIKRCYVKTGGLNVNGAATYATYGVGAKTGGTISGTNLIITNNTIDSGTGVGQRGGFSNTVTPANFNSFNSTSSISQLNWNATAPEGWSASSGSWPIPTGLTSTYINSAPANTTNVSIPADSVG